MLPDVPTQELRLTKCSRGYWTTAWTTNDGQRLKKTFGRDRAAARMEFDQFHALWKNDPSVRSPGSIAALTVDAACDRYQDYANASYKKHAENMADAMRTLRKLCGTLPVARIGVSDLAAVQSQMVADGLSRNTVNQRVGRIRSVWKWFVAERIVPAERLVELGSLAALRPGRAVQLPDGTYAAPPNPEPPRDVPEHLIDAVCEAVPPTLRAMIRVQLLTGMRPGELVIMRPCDIDQREATWVYRPASHKNAHRGQKREVYIGPSAQAWLKPYLDRRTDAYLFTPRQAMSERYAARETHRHQPVKPPATERKIGDQWTVGAYANAIRKACIRLDIPEWSPNELRHTAATLLARRFGPQAASAILGHANIDTLKFYDHSAADIARATAQSAG